MKLMEPVVEYFKNRGNLTYWEYTALPDDGNRYEIINGELKMTPAPKISHQEISLNIEYEIRTHIKKHNLGKVFDAPVDVLLENKIVVQPDIVFILKENYEIITEDNIKGAPDLIIEILSPSTTHYDMFEKKEIYEKYGVKEYWIVDPDKQWVEVYVSHNKKFKLIQKAEKEGRIKSFVINEFYIDFKTIFEE